MQQKGTVLIADFVHPILQKGLEDFGYGCEYQPEIRTEEVLSVIHRYSGLIVNSKIHVDQLMLEKANKLKFVGRLGSGMEIIDSSFARSKGIAVFNSPEGNRNAVAEHVIGMILGFANHLISSDREVRQKIWEREKNRGFELKGKKLAVIGFGNTGGTLAKKLKGFEMEVLAYDKYKRNYAADFPWIRECSMEEIFEQAEIVSLHLPLTEETNHLADLGFFKKFSNKILFVNTSRGRIAKTEDLIKALKEEIIIGACLDVFENEKPWSFSQEEKKMYSELYGLANVVLSPHVAGWTKESKILLAEVLLNKIKTLE